MMLDDYAVVRRELHQHGPWQCVEMGCMYRVLLSGHSVFDAIMPAGASTRTGCCLVSRCCLQVCVASTAAWPSLI